MMDCKKALTESQGDLDGAVDILRKKGVATAAKRDGSIAALAVADLAARFDRTCIVSLEQVMGCGMGGCYSCVVRVRQADRPRFVRSCIDGPVFDASAIVWEELTH